MDRKFTLPFGSPANAASSVERLHAAFARKNGCSVGPGQIGTDVPLADAEAMLVAFSRLRYTERGPSPAVGPV